MRFSWNHFGFSVPEANFNDVSGTLTADPDVIVLGGGLSQIDGVIQDLSVAAQKAQIGDFSTARLTLAQGGDSSGARGAAYAAWQEANT